MNFFGHATVATWHRVEPAFVLGSMLPDFASMMRIRLGEVRHRQVGAGVELHHRTDAAFHAAPTFLSLCSEASGELMERGVQRGPARAVGHVGTELLLDGWLVRSEDAREAYVEALRAARGQALDRTVQWRDAEGPARLRELCERLLSWGVPDGYGEPELVAERLSLTLSRRPLLALDEHAREVVRDRLSAMQQRVLSRAETLMGELREALPDVKPDGRNLTREGEVSA
ncbi:MAG: hypothetical protein ACOCUS_00380 [Polyangiales bacterium]